MTRVVIDVDGGHGDGLSCASSNGGNCRFMSLTEITMHNRTGTIGSLCVCNLFENEHGFPEKLRVVENNRVMRCRQCHEAESRLAKSSAN